MTRLQSLPRGRAPGLLASALAGAACVPGFAPLHIFPLPILALAALAWAVERAPDTRAAGRLGFAFGMGLFVAGVGWLYVALNRFGGMPPWLAIPVMAVFCAYLSLFPAAACALSRRAVPGWRIWALAGAWTILEWVRGWLFTGFPWLAVGYSQVPHSPLAGLAPVVGVFGVGLAAGACAAGLAALGAVSTRRAGAAVVAALLSCGFAARWVEWTEATGRTLGVTLVQSNVAQDAKFREDRLGGLLADLTQAVESARTALVVLPETALPMFLQHVPTGTLERLSAGASARGGDVVVGVFENDPPGSERYYNAVLSLGVSPPQSYRKDHLVPFGEFIPLEGVLGPLIRDWLHIPLSSQSRGGSRQKPLQVAGERVAMNICYEDVFGEEIIRQLPEAGLLANVSNDAWYGHSWAAEQHLQIAQTRALETGRWMIRATNTGVTAAIDHLGRTQAQLPQFEAGTLVVEAQVRRGATPYVRAGNGPAVLAASALLVLALWRRLPAPAA